MNPHNDKNEVIWNYDDIDMDILKVYNYDTLLGYFRIDTNIFTWTNRKINTQLLQTVMSQYNEAKHEAESMKEQ